jgi:hypothetical protein
LKNIDWKRLSVVEMASGIEVIYLSKLFRDNPFLHKKIIKHALDEYRHSSIFYKYSKLYSYNNSNLSSAQSLIGLAGLGSSPVDREEKNIFKSCAYVYVGEYRALEFNNQATRLITNKKIIQDIKVIEDDEMNHASGVMKYLKTFPFYKYFGHILYFKFRYFFQKLKNRKIINNLQGKTGNFLAKNLFNLIPSSLFITKKPITSLELALKDAKSM